MWCNLSICLHIHSKFIQTPSLLVSSCSPSFHLCKWRLLVSKFWVCILPIISSGLQNSGKTSVSLSLQSNLRSQTFIKLSNFSDIFGKNNLWSHVFQHVPLPCVPSPFYANRHQFSPFNLSCYQTIGLDAHMCIRHIKKLIYLTDTLRMAEKNRYIDKLQNGGKIQMCHHRRWMLMWTKSLKKCR